MTGCVTDHSQAERRGRKLPAVRFERPGAPVYRAMSETFVLSYDLPSSISEGEE